MDGHPASIDADLDRMATAPRKNRSQDRLLERVIRVAIALQWPSLAERSGEHAGVLARAIRVDPPALRGGDRRLFVPRTHGRTLQRLFGDAGARQDGAHRLDVNRLGVVRRAHHRHLSIRELERRQ